MRRIIFLASTILGLMPATSPAFGLKTHIFIAEELYEDIRLDCKVKIEKIDIEVPGDVCISIRNHKYNFLSGALGPDIYPDLITGQVTAHPGIPGGWSTSDWINHIYKDARTGEELAFAAGYLVHAASDAFGHSYVNAYSGDIFELKDERAVELRHFVLEKYIDSKLPNLNYSSMSLSAPKEFARKKFIYDDDAAHQSLKSGVSLHIYAMNNVRKEVSSLHDSLEQLEGEAARAIADLIAAGIELNTKLATGEAALLTAELGLGVHSEQLKLAKAALDLAKSAFDSAVSALDTNKSAILLHDQRAKAAREAINGAEAAAKEANRIISEGEKALIGLDDRLAGIQRYITVRSCSIVTRSICTVACPFCGDLCKNVEREVCQTVTKISDEWQNLYNHISDLKRQVANARHQASDAAITISRKILEEANNIQLKIEAESLTASLELARAAAQVAYDVERGRYEMALDASNASLAAVKKIREEIEKLREQLVDVNGIKDAIEALIDNSNILSFYTGNWLSGLDDSGAEYIKTATKVSQLLLEGESGVFSEYARWVQCYGSSFTPQPYQLGEFTCKAEEFYRNINSQFNELVYKALPPPFSDLYDRYVNLQESLKKEIRRAGEDAAIEIVKLASPDRATAEFIELLARPENATEGKLIDVFRGSIDSTRKDLLEFDRVSILVNADIGLKNGKLDPEKFIALKSAVLLSKIALLDRSGLNTLTWRLGGSTSLTKANSKDVVGVRYSILYDALRSIDGNHQWQPFGLPYPRAHSKPEPANPGERNYGYGPADSKRKGFILFTDENLRRVVFSQIFSAPISGQISNRSELKLPIYPFPECAAEPFPIAFNNDGSAREYSVGCQGGGANKKAATPLRVKAVKTWRGFWYWLGYRP